MYGYIVVVLCVVSVPLIVLALNRTFLEISWRRRSFGGLIFAREVFLLILPGIMLYALGIYKNYKFFYVTEESMREATLFSLYGLWGFVLTVAVISRVLLPHKYLRPPKKMELTSYDWAIFGQIYKVSLIALIVLTCFFLAMGMKHSLVSALGGIDLMAVRLQNRYMIAIPTIFMSLYRFLYVLASILFGLLFLRLSWISKIFGIFVILFSVSFLGDKAPILWSIITIVLAYISVSPKVNFFKLMRGGIILGLLSLFGLYALAYLQFGGIGPGEFFEFVVGRAGLGQMFGAYEQFGLRLRDINYVWHSVPFANIFIDYPVFNKDLMMSSWAAANSADETGVVNSFFIGEAFAIGGYPLLIASPAIVGASYCASIFVLMAFCHRFFGLTVPAARALLQFIVPSFFVLTADMAGFLFLKLLIIFLIFCVILWTVRSLLFSRSIMERERRRLPAAVS